MKFYLAPMEGLTGYVFRNVHHEMFPGLDRYYTPFLAANQKYSFKSSIQKDILPDNNKGLPVAPQIMTRYPDQFLRAVDQMVAFGYDEVNLNLGCPSGTVVSKHKGSGFLEDPDELDEFFAEVFKEEPKAKITVKTRIGLRHPEEMEELLPVFNNHPIKELTIHPRVREEFYRGKVHMDVFARCLKESTNPVCYNGDIVSADGYKELVEKFPELNAVMIGRGLISNPALVREIQGGSALTRDELKAFHDKLLDTYLENIQEEKNALYRMFEAWTYFADDFEDSDRPVRRIRKAKKLEEYKAAVDRVFTECEFRLPDF